MQDPSQPVLPKARSVAGIDAEVIASIAIKLIGERLERMLASLHEPITFKPHEPRRDR